MKICLVNKFHYIKGGSETYYFGLGELLKKKGHDVIYFSMKDKKNVPCEQEKYFVDNVDFNCKMSPGRLVKTSLKMLYSFEAKKQFEKLIMDERPDLIHLNIFQSQLTGSIVDVAKKYNLPVIYTAHDLKSVCPNYMMLNHGHVCEKCLHGNYINCFRSCCMKNSRAKSLLAAMESTVYKQRKIYKKIDLVITPSKFYKNKLEESGVFDCDIVHIPNFLPEGTEYKNVRNGGDYFLYFGRLSIEKGIKNLVKAYARASTSKPLYIVGTGPEENAIRDYIQKYKMEKKICMLGFKSGDELIELVQNAFAVCLVSTWYENGPYTIMEAQAVGKPVIVSDLGGLPELVTDSFLGSVCHKPYIKNIIKTINRYDDLTEINGDRISGHALKKYHHENYVESMINIYSTLVEGYNNGEDQKTECNSFR